MKKVLYPLFSLLFVLLLSCGGDAPAGEEGDENTAEEMVDEAMDEMEDMMEEEEADENEREISIEAIPQNVKDAIAKKYPGYSISEADEVTAEDGSVSYDVEIEKEGSELEVMYSSKGEFLGEEMDEDEEGDVDENDEEDTDM